MIEQGHKKVEARLSKTRTPPFGHVSPGDTLFFKRTGGNIFARTIVLQVDTHTNLTKHCLLNLKQKYYNACDPLNTQASIRYWESKANANHAVFVWFDKLTQPRNPPHIERQYGRAWLTL